MLRDEFGIDTADWDKLSGLLEGTKISGTGASDTLYSGRTEATYPQLLFDPSYQMLFNEVRALLQEVKELRSDFRSRPLTSSILLTNLNNKGLSIRHPISVIVEEYDEECLARWPEANAHGLGPTLYEAIVDLKQNIVDLFSDLSDRDEESLGDLAIETLSTLKAYINKKE